MRKKQVEITDAILEQIERVTNTTVSGDDIVVFEAAAVSTETINKRGSIFHGAQISRSTLEDMAKLLNSGETSVPLHTLHQQADELPVGRVFQGRVEDEVDGTSVLKTMFYLSRSEKALIEKINLSVLDEVSVGLKTEHAMCSKCGFDFFGDDADFTHIFSQTCENDHTIGTDGTHLKLSGVENWMELSLVPRGASSKPKILSRAKRLVPQEQQDRLAADGKPIEATALFTSTQMERPMPKNGQNRNANEADDAGEEEDGQITAQLSQLTEAVTALTAKLDAAPQAAGADDADDNANGDGEADRIQSLEAQLSELSTKIDELTASANDNDDNDDGDDDVTLPTGGLSASAVADAGNKRPPLRASAFKTRRQKQH